MIFKEDFLHFIWRFRLYNSTELFCSSGERLEILNPGLANRHAGPDFSNAKLKIGGTFWAGNVEIHLRSSDWFAHHHEDDPAYDTIILHVVYEDDALIYRKDGNKIVSFILKDLFQPSLLQTYHQLINSAHSFPCEKQISSIEPVYVNSFLTRLTTERLQMKAGQIFRKLELSKGDWAAVFYYFMAGNFGFKVNTVPFELLADSLPYPLFAKHKDQPLQIEALIFGQAGFLNGNYIEDYPLQLHREYTFLKKKYNLNPVPVSMWKFLRMRPQNFPTVRLAQFAALITRSHHLFSQILELDLVSSFQDLFNKLPVHSYWNTHYHFGSITAQKNCQMGISSINNLIINGVALFLFAYGKYINDSILTDRALNLMEQLPAEKNAIVQEYESAGIVAGNAFRSQALLQLNKNYCTQKKCLNCVIGIKILNR